MAFSTVDELQETDLIESAEEVYVFPPSFAKQRLWFLDQMEPGNVSYNVTVAVRLGGSLDVSAFARSFNAVVARHEVLRTTFDLLDAEPVQVVHEAVTLTVPLFDLCELDAQQAETEARRLAEREAARPFDLQRGPVIRLILVRLGANDHIALLTSHHIVSDAWSKGILVREITALYEA